MVSTFEELEQVFQILPKVLGGTMETLLAVEGATDGAMAFTTTDDELKQLTVSLTSTLSNPNDIKTRLHDGNLTNQLTMLDTKVGLATALQKFVEKFNYTIADDNLSLKILRTDTPFKMRLIPGLRSMFEYDSLGEERSRSG